MTQRKKLKITSKTTGYSDEDIRHKREVHKQRAREYFYYHNTRCDTCRWIATIDRIRKEKRVNPPIIIRDESPNG